MQVLPSATREDREGCWFHDLLHRVSIQPSIHLTIKQPDTTDSLTGETTKNSNFGWMSQLSWYHVLSKIRCIYRSLNPYFTVDTEIYVGLVGKYYPIPIIIGPSFVVSSEFQTTVDVGFGKRCSIRAIWPRRPTALSLLRIVRAAIFISNSALMCLGVVNGCDRANSSRAWFSAASVT
jgi:hypothetical protein